MNEMRLIDANKVESSEVFCGTSDFAKDCRLSVDMLMLAQPSIDPETLPIVKELREELETVKQDGESCMKSIFKQSEMYMEIKKEATELREKLARYEQAEKDGRLIELPCKVGDDAWVLFDGGLYETRVKGISVSARGKDVILHFGGYPVKNAWGSEIGKTVFLTREEAEAALKEREME